MGSYVEREWVVGGGGLRGLYLREQSRPIVGQKCFE